MANTPARNWCFTVNNYGQFDQNLLRNLGASMIVKYLVFGREVGQNGTPHLQGFVSFTNQKSFNRVKQLLPLNCHIERANGTSYQAAEYCKKDEDFEAFGIEPRPVGRAGGEATQAKFQRTWELAKLGLLEQIDPDHRIQFYSTLKRIAKDFMFRPEPLENVCGLWIWGDSGAGKTHAVATQCPERYIKPLNKWWDGYQNEEVIHIDELGPSHTAWIAPYLKKWADKWPFDAEVKGGAMQIRPRRIIVTSNYSIEDMNFLAQDYGPIKRRFVQVLKTREQNIII